MGKMKNLALELEHEQAMLDQQLELKQLQREENMYERNTRQAEFDFERDSGAKP